MLPALAALQGCAHVSAPRGGPPDTIPPLLIAVEPDSLSVIPGFEGEVRFQFDEGISERNVELAVTLYPYEGRARISKRSREIRVRPRDRWVDGRIYHIVVDTVIQDLFNNRIERPIRFVFSTGTPITSNRVRGTVVDRVTEQRLPLARFDLIRMPDTVRYGAVADTAGRFRLDAVPVGEYLAIGYQDVNNNRRADGFDRSDTLAVEVGAADTLDLTFNVFHHDTIGPQLRRVVPIDSLTTELRFDQYLDPNVPLSVENVETLSLPDSVPVQVDSVLHDWQYRGYLQTLRLEQAAAARAAAAQAPGDTLAEAPIPEDTLPPPAPAPAGPPPTEAAQVEEIEPLPARRVLVIARTPIAPGAYLVQASRLLNLTGLEGGGEAQYEQPGPEPEESDEGTPDRPPGDERPRARERHPGKER